MTVSVDATASSTATAARPGPAHLDREGLATLIDLLREDGRTVIAPTVADGAIVYGEVTSVAQLPVGWGDRQQAGSYRLERRSDDAVFGYNMGPTSWRNCCDACRFPEQRTDQGLTA